MNSTQLSLDGPANLNMDATYIWNMCRPVGSAMFQSLIPLSGIIVPQL